MNTLKNALLVLVLLIGSLNYSTAAVNSCGDLLGSFHDEKSKGLKDDVLKYSNVIDFTDPSIKGRTFLTLMIDWVKPALDRFAKEGFVVANGDTVLNALDNVGNKVRVGALRGANEEKIIAIAEALSKKGPVNFYDLPNLIAQVDRSVDRYGLNTFFALASGGGVALKFYDGNFAYNVNYGTGKIEKDAQTGRSFGQGPGARESDKGSKGPNDVSDKNHLIELAAYVRSEEEAPSEMYRTILQIITNCDSGNYSKLSPIGQTGVSDFMAVYTAESDRHLMDPSFKSHAWDVALLEVTLLSSFYAKQSEIYIMYEDKFLNVPMTFTNKVYNQYQNSKKEWFERPAEFYDYWQRSSQPDLAVTSKDGRGTRSGLNITKPSFRLLGQKITAWEMKHNPKVVAAVTAELNSQGKNLFSELTSFLINKNAPKSLGDANSGKAYQITEAFVKFLDQVMKDGPAIQQAIIAKKI